MPVARNLEDSLAERGLGLIRRRFSLPRSFARTLFSCLNHAVTLYSTSLDMLRA